MKAVVKVGSGRRNVKLVDVPFPSFTEDEMLIKVHSVGVCGSDIHLWNEMQSWNCKLPLILGHEFSGTIHEIGKNVPGFVVGERVVCETAGYVCENCEQCKTGNYNLCKYRLGHGAMKDGALCEFIAVRPGIVHKIPNSISMVEAALIEPICVGLNAIIEKNRIKPAECCVIQGIGTIGVLCLQIAKLIGAFPIIMIGKECDTKRLRIVKDYGAHHFYVDSEINIESFTNSHAVDHIIDCSGDSNALELALKIIKRNGTITKIGWGKSPLNFNLDLLVAKAVTLQGSFSHTFISWERAIRLVENKRIDLKKLIGGCYDIQNWEQAFLAMEEGHNIKSVITIL